MNESDSLKKSYETGEDSYYLFTITNDQNPNEFHCRNAIVQTAYPYGSSYDVKWQ